MVVEFVEEFLIRHNLLEKRVIVAYSGGFDSTCLLHILSKLIRPENIVAAHLNHNWRGNESDNEEQVAKEFCKKLGVIFISEKASSDLPKTEQCARELRYDFFNRVAKNVDSTVLFSAHTKSDICETVLYRVVKGTGVKGLCAIPEMRELGSCTVYRPMLLVSRADVELYCEMQGLLPSFDSSNADNKYKRNFIRNRLAPLLSEINGSYENAVLNLTKASVNEESIVNEYLTILTTNLLEDDKILTTKFLALSEPVKQRFLYNLLVDNTFEYDYRTVQDVLSFISQSSDSKSGKTFSLDGSRFLFCSKEYIYIVSKALTAALEVVVDKVGEFDFGAYVFSVKKNTEKVTVFPKEGERCAFVDLSGVGFPFQLRYRQEGDVIQPFGMQQTIKLRKYFVNKGVPNHLKRCIILLCKKDEVMWVSGEGLSEKFRSQGVPEYILEFTKKVES